MHITKKPILFLISSKTMFDKSGYYQATLPMSTSWKHIKTILDGERYEINGVNIWECEWKRTGESVEVKDPQYGQTFYMSVYQIHTGAFIVTFAAGEFSNCVWGIYQEQ